MSPTALFVLTPFRLDGLCLGAFLAVLLRQQGAVPRVARALPWVAIGGAGVLLRLAALNRLTPSLAALTRPVRESSVVVLLACLLVRAVLAPSSAPVSRFFRSAAITWLGRYSYGLYVYHHFVSEYAALHGFRPWLASRLGSLPLAMLVIGVAGTALSAAVAWVSYQLFERRFLDLKRFFVSRDHTGAEPAPATDGAASEAR